MKILFYIILLVFVFFIFVVQKGQLRDLDSINYQKKIKIWSTNLIITILFSCYSALLGTVGLPDRRSYMYSFLVRYRYYNSIRDITSSFDEFGYVLLNIMIGKITNDGFWLFFIITFITTIINLNVLTKVTKKYYFALFFYFMSLNFFNSTFLFRQSLAVAFGNLAFYYLIKEKKIRSFVLILIAITFHTSAVVLFIIYYLYVIRKSKSFNLQFVLVLGFMMAVFIGGNSSLINNFALIEKYNQYDVSFGGGTLFSIFKGLPFYIITIISIMNMKKYIKHLQDYRFYIGALYIYSLMWILTYNMYWFFRVGWYFMAPALVGISIIFDSVINKKEKILIGFVFYSLLLAVTIRQMIITLY